MNQTTSQILSLTNEAAILLQRGRVSYANAAACKLLGADCVGKSTQSLLGQDVAGFQASSFVADIPLSKRSCIVRVSRLEEGQVAFLHCPDLAPDIVNDPFLYELRSGLMNINMAADRLREAAEQLGSQTMLSDLQSLTRSHYRLLRLIGNTSLLLSASRDSLPCAPRPMNLSSACRSLLETVALFYPGLQYRADLEENLTLTADPALVRQLLLNLLSNCLVHAGPDCQISISLLSSPSSVVLSVSDDGQGIPPELLHTVFDRYRYGFSLSQLDRGSGLGLTVARIITMAHGGTLLLESQPGRGTTVRASLSRPLPDRVRLSAPDSEADTLVRDVLIGLADCLPPDCYTERYLD